MNALDRSLVQWFPSYSHTAYFPNKALCEASWEVINLPKGKATVTKMLHKMDYDMIAVPENVLKVIWTDTLSSII